MLIPVYNPPIDDLEVSFLSQGISAGATSISVDNNNNFTQNDYIMIGREGREKTEIVQITGAVTPGSSLTIGPTVFPHEASEPVTRIRYNKIKYWRSTNGVDGTYSLLTTIDVDVDNADLQTTYDDTSGVSSYYYKVSYYNSTSTLETALSDPISGGGYDRNTAGFLIDELLRELQDPNEEETNRTELLSWFNECSDDLSTRAKRPYSFLHTRTVLNRTANDSSGVGSYLTIPSDILKFDMLQYNYQDSTTSPIVNQLYIVRVIPNEEYREKYSNVDFTDTTLNDDQLQEIAIDEAAGKIRLHPFSKTDGTNVFYLYYWKNFTQIDGEGDTFETPTPRVYKLYCLHKFYRRKAIKDTSLIPLSDRFLADYNAEVGKLKRLERLDSGSPKGLRFQPQDYKGNRRF